MYMHGIQDKRHAVYAFRKRSSRPPPIPPASFFFIIFSTCEFLLASLSFASLVKTIVSETLNRNFWAAHLVLLTVEKTNQQDGKTWNRRKNNCFHPILLPSLSVYQSCPFFFFWNKMMVFFDVKNGMHIKVEGKSSKKITVTTIFK